MSEDGIRGTQGIRRLCGGCIDGKDCMKIVLGDSQRVRYHSEISILFNARERTANKSTIVFDN